MTVAPQLLYSAERLQELFELPRLVEELQSYLQAGARGRAIIPKRELIFREKPFGAFGSMPAFSEELHLYINKVATMVVGQPSGVQAVVPVFNAHTGEMLAIMNGSTLTSMKCSAAAAVVTHACAQLDADKLAVIGSGVQALAQVIGVMAVRPIRQISIYSRQPEKRNQFADKLRNLYPNLESVEAVSTAADAIKGCDILITATTSIEPLIDGKNMNSHIHINCVGAHTHQSRELPKSLLEESILVVEDVETAIREAGDIHKKALDFENLLSFDKKTLQSQKTVFSSTGHAFFDLVTASHFLREKI